MIFVDFLSPVFTSLMNLRLFLAPPGENVSVWIPKTDTQKKAPVATHAAPQSSGGRDCKSLELTGRPASLFW